MTYNRDPNNGEYMLGAPRSKLYLKDGATGAEAVVTLRRLPFPRRDLAQHVRIDNGDGPRRQAFPPNQNARKTQAARKGNMSANGRNA